MDAGAVGQLGSKADPEGPQGQQSRDPPHCSEPPAASKPTGIWAPEQASMAEAAVGLSAPVSPPTPSCTPHPAGQKRDIYSSLLLALGKYFRGLLLIKDLQVSRLIPKYFINFVLLKNAIFLLLLYFIFLVT